MDYYLYTHSNADGIFYVGKGCGDRVKDKCLSKRSPEWHEASKDGYTTKIEANGTEADILSLEKIVIKSLIAQEVNLVNKYHNPNWEMPDESKKKLSDAQSGRKHNDETKKKISDSQSGENNNMFGQIGDKNPFFGKTHSDEVSKKISHAQAKRWQHYRLEKANNYGGSLWI